MAAIFKIVEPTVGDLVPVTATGTVPLYPLGYIARAADLQTGTTNVGAGQFMYMKGNNVTAIGQMVALSNGSAVLAGTVNSLSLNNVGFAAGNLSATSVYGWVQVQGFCDYALGTNQSIEAGKPLFVVAGTAGLIGSAGVQGLRVVGAVASNSFTSSQTSVSLYLNFPYLIGSAAQFS